MTSDLTQLSQNEWFKQGFYKITHFDLNTLINDEVVQQLMKNTQGKVCIDFKEEQPEIMKQLSNFGFNITLNGKEYN